MAAGGHRKRILSPAFVFSGVDAGDVFLDFAVRQGLRRMGLIAGLDTGPATPKARTSKKYLPGFR
jgi:hypothetical protein